MAQNQQNIRLAEAMGLMVRPAGQAHPPTWQGIGVIRETEHVPDFDCERPEGYYWRAKLLEWLALDDDRFFYFIRILADDVLQLPITTGNLKWTAAILNASPAQIAEAADRALREVGKINAA